MGDERPRTRRAGVPCVWPQRMWPPRGCACFLVLMSYIAALFFVLGAERSDADYGKGAAARNAGDYEKALQEWTVTSDDPRCMTGIGGLHHYGEGLPKDEAKAAEWYRKAAEKGEYRAIAQLAVFSLTGAGGVAQNPAEWRAKLEEIEGKDDYAGYILAFFCLDGYGGVKDIERAHAILDALVNKKGHGQLTDELKRAASLLAGKKAGVLDAGDMVSEALRDRAAFDKKYKDRRVIVSGRINSAERAGDYGSVIKLGPAASLKDNIAAVFYDPSQAGELSPLRPGAAVKFSGVYVGGHPFPLGDCVFTMFGCEVVPDGQRPEGQRP